MELPALPILAIQELVAFTLQFLAICVCFHLLLVHQEMLVHGQNVIHPMEIAIQSLSTAMMEIHALQTVAQFSMELLTAITISMLAIRAIHANHKFATLPMELAIPLQYNATTTTNVPTILA